MSLAPSTSSGTLAAAPTRSHLSLKGSTSLVHEFFTYCVQSILYQRNIYPPEDFKTVKKYGLQMLVTTDDSVADYLERAMNQLQDWLERGKVTRLVVAIVERETGETRERWQFDVEVLQKGDAVEAKENTPLSADDAKATAQNNTKQKTDAQIRAEIAAIIKQITASCTFLPVLEELCHFQILAYTDRDTEAPVEWTESDARLIAEGQAEQVKLRSFSTHVHRIDAMVAYRRGDDDD
ncbi:Mitotic spindle checkpoint component mad2 [Thecaphora frezii]